MEGAVSALLDYSLAMILFFIPLWRIFGRAGLPPVWSLLVFIPVVGFAIPLLVLAYSSWSHERRTG